ncbi:Hypothetical predicted protein [Podarcis lilfordi]|uniref:Uncharacterized protein n=1 Tax=Podarcis lilfordi TaxID=74358 RepID=A0AA35K906_9SAUR|nr:Hypothetical predicted protein [Podarcis lilfordi]
MVEPASSFVLSLSTSERARVARRLPIESARKERAKAAGRAARLLPSFPRRCLSEPLFMKGQQVRGEAAPGGVGGGPCRRSVGRVRGGLLLTEGREAEEEEKEEPPAAAAAASASSSSTATSGSPGGGEDTVIQMVHKCKTIPFVSRKQARQHPYHRQLTWLCLFYKTISPVFMTSISHH